MPDAIHKGKEKEKRKRKENAMKRTLIALGALTAAAAPAFASGTPETAGTGLLVTLFLGFGILIIACQLVPGAVLLWSLVRTLFAKTARATAPAAGR
jgi:hypothetical protein